MIDIVGPDFNPVENESCHIKKRYITFLFFHSHHYKTEFQFRIF